MKRHLYWIIAGLLLLPLASYTRAAIEDWSVTAASNNSASPNGAPEGMAPSGVNDTIREVMAQVRTWAEQAVSGGWGHEAGSADAYRINPEIQPTSYVSGASFRFQAGNANTGLSTFQVGSLAAVTIKLLGNDLSADDILKDGIYEVVHDGTDFELTGSSSALKGGAQTIWIPAGSMISRSSTGAASGSLETVTNFINLSTLDFDADVDEFAQFSVAMPKSWDLGVITPSFLWTAITSSGAVIWSMQCLSVGNDDPLDAAFGTVITGTDTLLAVTDSHLLTLSDVTCAGTPAENDQVIIQVYRDATDSGDTLGGDVLLLGIKVLYGTNASHD